MQRSDFLRNTHNSAGVQWTIKKKKKTKSKLS